MNVTVNGQERDVPDGSTLGALLETLQRDTQRGPLAVAVNLDVIPRENHGEHSLQEGDRVDLVTAVGGG